MRNKKLLIAIGVVLGVAVGAWLLLGSDVAKARTVLAQAEGIVEQSTAENLAHIAAAEFATAVASIGTAKQLIEGRDRKALPVAEQALREANHARATAQSGIETTRTAVLAAIQREVLYRPADGLAWTDATKDMSLYDGDRIATRKSSAALIRFTAGAETRVEEDSVVVVKRFVENRQSATLNMELTVAEGNVRSIVTPEAGKRMRLSLDLPQADIVVDSNEESGRVEVGTLIGEDKTARVSVFSGSAKIATKSGEELVVSDNQYAEISSGGTLTTSKSLPKAAQALAPGDDGTVYVHPTRPDVTFLWEAAAGCAVARIEVSSEPIFMDKVLDLTTDQARLTAKLLSDGNYLWRVSCIDAAGIQGAYTESQRFTLVRDGEPPTLEILSPAPRAVVSGTTIEARCRTEEQVMVFINGEEAVASGGGEYAFKVELKPGLNRIVFEAIDSAGNATHARQFVTQKAGS